jgi:hemolysin activation/secretion protein
MACVAVIGSPAFAQITPPVAVQPGRPQPQTPAQPEFDFRLEAPQRSPVPRAVDEIHFKLNDIRIEGTVVMKPADFRPLYAGLIGKDVTLSNILDVADAIEQRYRAMGYVLVRAFVPPQRVKDGIFTIKVSEGYVASASVEGGNRGARAITNDYLQRVLADRPLQIATIERALLLSNDLPGVSATGVLRPSATTPGASDLAVSESQPLVEGGLAVDNRGSQFSGFWTLTGDAEFNGLLGADQLGAAITASPDASQQISGQARYRRAIGSDGLVGSLIVTVAHGEPGSTLAQFGVLTDSWAVGPRFTYPIERSRAESVSLEGGLTFQDSRERLNAFSLDLSHDRWQVFDIGVSWLRNGLWGATWAANLDLAQGLPFLGGTDSHSAGLSRPDGLMDFTKITGIGRVQRPLIDALSAVVSVQGQLSSAPLITGEQIAFGGTQIGRGYYPGAITGDDGIGSALELRYDARTTNSVFRTIEPYVFVESAWTWYHRGTTNPPPGQNIASAGGGLRFFLPWNVYLDVEGARTLESVPGSDNGKQATKVLMDASVRF